MWIVLAALSALFAGLTSILAKVGIKNVNSHLATALRTIVVAVFAWVMVFIVGSHKDIASIDTRSLIFLILSGLATGCSWICYFKALQMGDVNKVAPIDKSSTVLTILLAFIILGEEITVAGICGLIAIAIGTFLMVQKKKESFPTTIPENSYAKERTTALPETTAMNDTVPSISIQIPEKNPMLSKETIAAEKAPASKKNYLWLILAVLSAVFASLTSILAKIGIENVESNLGTAIRTLVVLVLAWGIVFAQGKHTEIMTIDKKSWLFIGLSGIATGLSWLCFYKALAMGNASVVVSIDKLSILITVLFSYFFLKEKLSIKAIIGLALLVAGTLVMAIFS